MKKFIAGFLLMISALALSGYLQNEDFKSQSDLESLGGNVSQLLNDTKIYLTADGLNKRLDQAIIDGDLAGGAGNDLNIATDPSFEKESAPGTCTNCTINYIDTTVHLASQTNTKFARINFGVSSAGDYTDTYVIDSSFNSKDAFLRIALRTTRADVNLEVYSNSNLKYQVEVNNDGDWHIYEIPFVAESTNISFKIDATSASTTAIDMDLINFGALPDGYIGNISQAHFVGSLLWGSANCSWTSTAASLAAYSADADCSVIETIGKVEEPATKIPAITISDARTDGTYIVKLFGRMTNTLSDTQCRFSLSSSSSYENQQTAIMSGVTNESTNTISGEFKFENSGSKTVQLLVERSFGTGNCNLAADNNGGIRNVKFAVSFEPDASDKIAAQRGTTTAEFENNFSAKISNAGAVSGENLDWIDGNCSTSDTSLQSCTWNTGLFTSTPNCTVSVNSGASANDLTALIASVSSSSISVRTMNNTAKSAQSFYISCQRSDTDFNLGQWIVGLFKDTNIKKVADNFSTTEIEWGLWNGDPLYRRCYSVPSDVTTTATLTTWATGLTPINSINYSGTLWVLRSITNNGSSTDLSTIDYNSSTGVVRGVVAGTWKIGAGTSFCMEYTK